MVVVHFALGKAYDDLGEYGRAIEHFDQANSLKKRTSKHYDRNAHAKLVDQLIWRFTPEFFARNKDMAHDWDVPVLIVGMPRSGTTLAEQIISSHPEVIAGGELSFWADHARDFGVDRAGRIDPGWIRETQAAYRARLASNLHNSARGSPTNCHRTFNISVWCMQPFPRRASSIVAAIRLIHAFRSTLPTLRGAWILPSIGNGLLITTINTPD